MKILRQSLLAAGAFALLAFTAPPAQAARVPAPVNGDIFLGVRAISGQGNATSYLVNLGPNAQFRTPSAGSTLTLSSIGNIDQDLAATFGSNWRTRTDLQWGVFGTTASGVSTLYGSRKQDPVGTFAAPWSALDLNGLNGTSSVISGVVAGIGGYLDGDATANSAVATLQVNSLSTSSYFKQVATDGTTDFGSLSQWLSIEGSFGPGGSALDFFRLDSTGVTNLGTFKFKDSGKLSFTAHIGSNASPVVKFADEGFSVKENAGVAAVTLERLGDASAAASVLISTGGGTAVVGTDYTAQTSVVVNFAAGERTTIATVPVIRRPGSFADRAFNVTLSGASGAAIVGPSTASVTISDVAEFTFVANGIDVRAHTDESPSLITVAINRVTSTSGAASVDVAVTGGDLVNGTAYQTFSSQTVSFLDGEATKNVQIQLDSIPAGSLPGSIILTLGNATGGALGVDSTITINVLPNTGEISFTESSYAVSALDQSNSPSLVTVPLTRSNGTTGAVSVTVLASSATLTSGTHYNFVGSNVVTFAAGSSTASVSIQLNAIPGQTGTIDLSLDDPSGYASLGLDEASIFISGSAGAITLGASSINVNEAAGVVNIPVIRSGGNSGLVTVKLSTTDGTAVSTVGATQDFTARSNFTVEFADGVNVVQVPIALFNTVANEPNEFFTVSLSNPDGTTLGTPATATVYIVDADTVKPTLTLTAPAANAKLTGTTGVLVTGSAADNKGVDKVEIQLNDGAYQSATLASTTKGFDYSLLITPQTGTNTINVRSVDRGTNVSAVITRSFVYNDPFPAVAGSYNGLVRADEDTESSNSTNGFLNVTILPTGTLTGKLSIDGLLLSFSGIIGNDGVALFGAAKTPTISVERPNKPSVVVSLELNLSEPASGKLTGEVKQYNRRTLTATSIVDTDRAGFDGKTPATSVAGRYLENKGVYTAVFPSVEPQGGLLPEDYPQGHGFGTVTLKSTGILSLAGTLSDGTTFTASAPLSKSYEWPLFAQIYNKLGSIGGKITLDDGVTHPDDDLTGEDLFWFRPYQNVQHYPYGWPEGLNISLFGAKYVVPTTSSVLPGLAGTSGSAELKFTEGLLETTVTKYVNIDSKNKVTIAASDKSFTLKLTPASGLLSGTFTHSDSTKPAFKGVIFQKGADAGAYGFFLSTAPKVRDGLGEGGSLEIKAKAAPVN